MALLNDFEILKKRILQGFCKENRNRNKGLNPITSNKIFVM